MPTLVTSGDPYTTTITIAANSAEVIKDVLMRAEYPYGYTLLNATPAADGDNVWVLGDLAPGDKKVITLKGSIVGEDNEERTFRFYAGVADPGNPLALKSPLVSTTQTLAIARPSVGLSLSLNGSSDTDFASPPGKMIQATLHFQNNSKVKLTNGKLEVVLSGNALDKFSVTAQGGGFYDSSSGRITWQAPDVATLSEILPGEGDGVTFSFQALSNLPAGSKNQEIDITGTLTGSQENAPALVSKLTRSVKISSGVTLSGKSLYSRGPFKNTGAIPPKAEKDTTYTITLSLGNNLNDLSGVKVTGKLGANTSFIAAATSTEKLTFDQASNTVTWDAGNVSGGTGFNTANREVSFQVLLHPSIGQIGTVPILLSALSLTGTDNFTNQAVSATAPNVTTRFSSDPTFIQGDETVVK